MMRLTLVIFSVAILKLCTCDVQTKYCSGGPYDIFTKCGSSCEPTCSRPVVGACTQSCISNVCRCQPGFYRRELDQRCVTLNECGLIRGLPLNGGIQYPLQGVLQYSSLGGSQFPRPGGSVNSGRPSHIIIQQSEPSSGIQYPSQGVLQYTSHGGSQHPRPSGSINSGRPSQIIIQQSEPSSHLQYLPQTGPQHSLNVRPQYPQQGGSQYSLFSGPQSAPQNGPQYSAVIRPQYPSQSGPQYTSPIRPQYPSQGGRPNVQHLKQIPIVINSNENSEPCLD